MKTTIYQYDDYRKFLRDLYQELKETKRAFSFRFFAREAGFTSPNYLQLVMNGERNLSPASIQKFSKGLRLGKQEAEFFENLVLFNQSKSAEEKTRYFQRMARNRRFRGIKQLEREQFEYYARWYYPAVRELVQLSSFKEDPEWISKHLRPKITSRQAQQALELLFKLGLLSRDADGKLHQVNPLVTSGAEVSSLAVTNFHKEMLREASASIERFPASVRDISGVMVAIPKNKIPELKERVSKFRKELLSLMEEGGQKSDIVMQLNVQLFPLSTTGDDR